AGASEEALASLTRYGEALGLMFQIVDDLLDVEGTPEQTGKRTNKDANAGKRTYPALLGPEASRREALRLRDEAIGVLAGLGPPAEPLRDLAGRMATRTR